MNNQELLKRLEYSALAYSNKYPYIPGCELLFIDTGKIGVQLLVKAEQDELMIAFRGTDSLEDAITDVRFWKQTIPYNNNSSKIRVHTGFINAYKSDCVRNTVWNLITPDIHRIVVTGHSYGAALAVLCAVDLQYNFDKIDYEVFLYGCPKVGNRAFAKSYNKRLFKTYRVENSNDAVTKVPFWIMGYRHVGIRIHVGAPRLFFWLSVKDHSLRRYYENIWKRLGV
ncbi:MAG: Lipase (class 3) [Firmicutes bacterium ADurb.Bin193]|nr:MAG: Lipase (class 3) [Firmicutes bacterium ADurb.Bin193]